MAPITRRKKVTQVRPLTSLPFDLVCLIMYKVGAKSSKDVFKYRICCKVMKVAGESSEVYRELDIFGILKLLCLLDKRDETLNKCRQHESLLLMFWDAMLHLLRAGDKTELQKTAGMGQKDAIFMNAMPLLVESRRNKEEALKVLNDAFRGSGRTNEVHKILSRIGGLVFGRNSDLLKLIFHGRTRTCRTHHGNKYGRAFSHNINGYWIATFVFGKLVLLNLLLFLIWIIFNSCNVKNQTHYGLV